MSSSVATPVRLSFFLFAAFFLAASFALAIAANVIGFAKLNASQLQQTFISTGSIKFKSGVGKSGEDLMIAGNVINGISFVGSLFMVAFLGKRSGYLWTSAVILCIAFIAVALLIAGAACLTAAVHEGRDLARLSIIFNDTIAYDTGLWLGWAAVGTELVAIGILFSAIIFAAFI
ncbi:hypothetical protein MCUN1_001071 [Malassezia cuniculi]|uniref:Uncharacterized protein n=1 Tax=Malassezia cuniculi TaxID=948313 RepID=A0AAF0ET32_9BASI|nr:hypothetical protein MCUN1_001071 [Malassezia cuniculi]